jgi:hypothetical protein
MPVKVDLLVLAADDDIIPNASLIREFRKEQLPWNLNNIF